MKWTKYEIVFMPFVLFTCLLFLYAIRTHHEEKEQIEDGLLVSPPTHLRTYYNARLYLLPPHWETSLFFIPHKKSLQIQKMLKKDLSLSLHYSDSYIHIMERSSGYLVEFQHAHCFRIVGHE